MTARISFEHVLLRACVVVASLAAACAPTLTDDTTLVGAPRVLAALTEPPEAHPREAIQVSVLVAPVARRSALELAFCTTPPAVGDPRPVSDACLTEKGIPLSVDGSTATGLVPADACARFGPDPVASDARPRDPDDTGGFYQPLRITLLDAISVESLRIQCALPDAPADLARQLADRYLPNHNPHQPALERRTSDGWRSFDTVTAGESVSLRVRWDAASREKYVHLRPDGAALEDRVEAMSVSWFSDGGSFAEAVTGLAEEEPGNDTINSFAAPGSGPLTVWIVLRDSRGGSAFLTRSVHVQGR
jgi:hypothetical protein